MCSTSPIAIALPEGKLSVHIKYPVTWFVQPSAFNVDIDDNTAAAPLMSPFIIACEGSDGLSEIPPESYITPLPTMIRCGFEFFFAPPAGLYVKRTIRGGSTLPRLTPMIPPQPIANN